MESLSLPLIVQRTPSASVSCPLSPQTPVPQPYVVSTWTFPLTARGNMSNLQHITWSVLGNLNNLRHFRDLKRSLRENSDPFGIHHVEICVGFGQHTFPEIMHLSWARDWTSVSTFSHPPDWLCIFYRNTIDIVIMKHVSLHKDEWNCIQT